MQQERVIDVVEEFSSPDQTEGYQEAFRKWRRRKKNPYAYRFTKDPRETAFSEHQAAVNDSSAQAEQTVLHRIGLLTAYALLAYLLIENALDKLLVLILNGYGIHVEIVYWGQSRLYGEERAVFWVATLVSLLKYLIPAAGILLTLRMPHKVSMPLPILRPRQLLYGGTLMMLLSVGLGMFCVSRSGELEKYRLISGAVDSNTGHLIQYMLFTIFVPPLVTELLLHGALFQVIRQFGDAFAIGTTTVLATLMMHNIPDAVRIGIVTLTISYFQIRTGSFATAVLLHIIHEICMFAVYYADTFSGTYSLEWWITILAPCLVSVITGISLLLHKHRQKPAARSSPTYLSSWEKATAFFTSMPMAAFIIACVLMLVITTLLE